MFRNQPEADFKKLLKFIQETEFESAGFFPYYREKGTPAASMAGQVPADVKKTRLKALVEAQSRAVDRINSRLIGKTVAVLMDSGVSGRAQFQAPDIDGHINIDAPNPLPPGKFIKAGIISASGYIRRGVIR